MGTFCLSLHAAYRCRHAGACCTNWAVPAEPRVIHIVRAQQISAPRPVAALFLPAGGSADPGWTVARDPDGDCVFFDRHAGRLCVIHRDAGAAALPSACRHFPRQLLRDDRGTFISLSHFCPTAAALLLRNDPLQMVEAQPPLRIPEPVEGMDATGALPPLVRPGMLSSVESYAAWEQACVATFARADLDWLGALDVVAAATERVRSWCPRDGPLAGAIATAFRTARAGEGADTSAQARAIETVRALAGDRVAADIAHLDNFEPTWTEMVAPGFAPFDAAMKNYLAARVFANWLAYQGRGLRTIVEWLRVCAAVVRHHLVRRAQASQRPVEADDFIEAVRMADLLLLHVIDTQDFAWRFASAEGPEFR